MFAIILVLCLFQAAYSMNSHQFHFSGGNIAYGSVPREVYIVGYWYIHRNDSRFQDLFKMGYKQDHLRNILYVCKENIDSKLISAGSIAAKRQKIDKVNSLLTGFNPRKVTPYINDLHDCQALKLEDYELKVSYSNGSPIKVKRFTVVHHFKQHGSVLFVDAWGVAAFHYRAKHTDAHRLKYCENDEIAFPVIFNKRPVCPRPALQSTIVQNGLLTVYKPNIISVQKTAYRCYLETTYITTKQEFFGAKSNNLPLVQVVQPILDKDVCLEWVKTRNCNGISTKIKLLSYSRFNGKMTKISDTRIATTNKILPLKYRWMYTYQYTIANCIIDVGYIRTTPPFNNMLTSWGLIGSDHLYGSNFTQSGGEIIVWKAFETKDLCNYVPLSSFDAKRITYNSKDFLEQDPNPGASEMYHFVSDVEKSVYTSDDTQVTSHELYNCIDDDTNQTLYAINDGIILSWQEGASLNDEEGDFLDIDITKSQKKYHVHYAFDDVTQLETDSDTDKTLISTPGGGGQEDSSCSSNGEIPDSPCRQTHDVHFSQSHNISNEDFIPKRQADVKPTLSEKDKSTTLFAMVNYLAYKFREYQNHEVVRRATSWCENQQHLYDIQQMLARSSPSTIISSYLNRPVQAENIGNGVYNTHYCNIIEDYIVVDNLYVDNHDIAPKLRVPYRDLYEKAGVTINPNYCFTMPIVIFREHMGANKYKIGQMYNDHTISTVEMPWIEECKFDRYFFHYIGHEIHVFMSYKRISITHIDVLFDYALRLKNNVNQLKSMHNGTASKRKLIEPLLENTRFVDIHTKYQPSFMKPIVLGFQNTETYSYKQRRRSISSLEGLLAHLSASRFDDRKLRERTRGNVTFGPSGSVFKHAVEGVASGLKILTDSIGDVIEHAIERGGGVLDTAIGTTSDTLENVADFFSGGVIKIIIILVALAAVGIFIYYIFKEKLLQNDDSNVTKSHIQSTSRQFNHIPMYEQNLQPQNCSTVTERRTNYDYIEDF